MAIDDQYTKSLFHFNSNLTDESGKVWSAANGASISTTQVKFGNSSLYLNGTNQYLSTSQKTDITLTNSGYTIDCWIYPLANNTESCVFFLGDNQNSDGYALYLNREGTCRFHLLSSGQPRYYVGTSTIPPINTWTHIAYTNTGTTEMLFLNGTMVASNSSNLYFPTNTTYCWLGQYGYSGGAYFNGYIDEFRISKTARWTANFTPPAIPYATPCLPTSTGGTITNVNGRTIHTFTSSGTFTAAGNGNVDVLVVAGGGGASAGWNLYGGGSGGGAGGMIISNSMSISPNSYSVIIGNGGNSAINQLSANSNGGNSSFNNLIAVGGGKGGNYYGGGTVNGENGGSGGGAWPSGGIGGQGTAGQGNAGGNYRGNYSGGSGGGGAGSVGSNSNVDGVNYSPGGSGATSSLSGSTVTYASGGYGTGYSTSTSYGGDVQPSNTGNGGNSSCNKTASNGASGIVIISYNSTSNVDDQYTTSLLHFDNNIIDQSGKIWTSYNSTTTSSSQSKFGGSSLYLNGTNQYLTTPNNSDLNFGNGNFTIDWWEYRLSSIRGCPVYSSDTIPSFTGIIAGYAYNGNLWVAITSNGSSWDILPANPSDYFSVGTLDLNVWNHFAVVRSGNTFYGFKNGNLTTTRVSIGSILPSVLPCIGKTQSEYYFNGYIDEFRISKGIARWTANFSPPTTAYAGSGGTVIQPTSYSIHPISFF